MGGSEKNRCVALLLLAAGSLFGGGVLGDSLGTFRDGVLGQLTGQEQTDGGLDLATADG